VRGEHASPTGSSSRHSGSSPRARGTHLRHHRRTVARRVIPACAGNTALILIYGWMPTGHPRVRGEHGADPDLWVDAYGSSPRARGTRSLCRTLLVQGRVIPACAGNTGPHQVGDAEIAGHPRVRGEHAISGCAAKSQLGSSPRARGTLQQSQRKADLASSPRARGTPGVERCIPAPRRVIPACAGNTPAVAAQSRPGLGHPRVRGEHSVWEMNAGEPDGSSPRARGTRNRAQTIDSTSRVIPACAGNTAPHSNRLLKAAGHPRVRGEHVGAPCRP